MINVLCIGDVVKKRACEFLSKQIPDLKRRYNIDLVIANGENSADGNGITPHSAKQLFEAGVDIITGGNHTLKRKEVYDLLETNPYITCPDNIESATVGKAICFYDMGSYKIAVINLCGTVYMEPAKNAFDTVDRLIEIAEKENAGVIIVDFHAEATSEKKALGFYLDGRVSVLFGTHTHVPTADLKILPKGTGYITDLGMCGPDESVLGIDPQIIINRFKGISYDRFTAPDTDTVFNACIFTIDQKSGKTVDCKQIIF